jgi:hypothetical protein
MGSFTTVLFTKTYNNQIKKDEPGGAYSATISAADSQSMSLNE